MENEKKFFLKEEFINLIFITILMFCISGCGSSISSIKGTSIANDKTDILVNKAVESDNIEEVKQDQNYCEVPLDDYEGEVYDFLNGKYLYDSEYRSWKDQNVNGIYHDKNMLIIRGKCYYPIDKNTYRLGEFPLTLEWLKENENYYLQWNNYLIFRTDSYHIIIYNIESGERKEIIPIEGVTLNEAPWLFVCDGNIILSYIDYNGAVIKAVFIQIDIISGEVTELDTKDYECYQFIIQADGSILMLATNGKALIRELVLLDEGIKPIHIIDKEGRPSGYLALRDSNSHGIFYEKEHYSISDGTELIKVQEDGKETVIAAIYEELDNRNMPKFPWGPKLFLDDCILTIDSGSGTYEKYDYQMNHLGTYTWREKRDDFEYLGFIIEKDTFYIFWLDETEQILEISKKKIE
jgi:hypothetical protein